MTELAYAIPVDPDLADKIVREWLHRHINYALATEADFRFSDADRDAAAKDITAMWRVLEYLGDED